MIQVLPTSKRKFRIEAKKAAAANPYATLHVIEECGHACVIEQSVACNEAVHTFIHHNNVYEKVSSNVELRLPDTLVLGGFLVAGLFIICSLF